VASLALTTSVRRFEEEWPAAVVTGPGIVRLLVRTSSGRAHLVEVDGAEQPLVARPIYDRETLRAFAAETVRLANQWHLSNPKLLAKPLPVFCPISRENPLALGVPPLRGRADRRNRPSVHGTAGAEAEHRVRAGTGARPRFRWTILNAASAAFSASTRPNPAPDHFACRPARA